MSVCGMCVSMCVCVVCVSVSVCVSVCHYYVYMYMYLRFLLLTQVHGADNRGTVPLACLAEVGHGFRDHHMTKKLPPHITKCGVGNGHGGESDGTLLVQQPHSSLCGTRGEELYVVPLVARDPSR